MHSGRVQNPAALDITLQVLPLRSREAGMVGIKKQGIESAEVIGIIQSRSHGGDIVEVNGITPQCLGQHREVLVRVVMLAFMA